MLVLEGLFKVAVKVATHFPRLPTNVHYQSPWIIFCIFSKQFVAKILSLVIFFST